MRKSRFGQSLCSQLCQPFPNLTIAQLLHQKLTLVLLYTLGYNED
jgi:hypothetical protein